MAEASKIDSNVTGLRIAAETTLGVLPGSPTWYDLEPNTYNDFGGNLSLVARNPISTSRKRKKGVITDLDASGGFNQDLTFSNFSALWPGLFLSNKRTKFTRVSDGTGSGGPSPVESVGVSNDIVFASDVSSFVRVGDLHFITGSGESANNGLKEVTAVATDTVTYAETLTAEATAPSGMTVRLVGHEFGSTIADITRSSGSLPVMTVDEDLSAILIPGEFVFIGGDDTSASGDAYTTAANNGFARLQAITSTSLTFDKTSGGADGETEMSSEDISGTTKSIRIFFGDIVRDEDSDATNFNRQTYTVERKLGVANPTSAPSEIQSEALTGSIMNEFALNVAQADKVTFDITFISTDNVQRSGASGFEPLSNTGTVEVVEQATAYNTSSDFTRIKLAEVRPTQGGVAELAAPVPLFAFVTDLTLNVSNNSTPNKAVSVLGAFDVTAGTFELSGNITAYFADIAAVQAVRNNADVTLDFALVKDFGTGVEQRKSGILIDIPLIALGDGRLNVVQDEAITLPLATDAAEYDPFGHTAVLHEFFYLPNAADA